MIELSDISKIGFGCYRVSVHSREHANALRHALTEGCNLIDTASNYDDGGSEELVGSLLKQTSDRNVFLVTKAGYISGRNLKVFEDLGRKVAAADIHIDFKHSIDPVYLDAQLGISQTRLGRTCIDGFLLHSPEYYFEQREPKTSKAEYYHRIKKAFEFLEEKVQGGSIRYYGVSSNTFLTDKENATELSELLAIANDVSTNNHFKLIQFPYNLIEDSATTRAGKETKSFVEIARENGLHTFANRPLNANSNSGVMRLVLPAFDKVHIDDEKAFTTQAQFFDMIEGRLSKVDPQSRLSDFAMVQYLKDNWMKLPNAQVFQKLFHATVKPFIHSIYSESIPIEVWNAFNAFKDAAWIYCQKIESLRVKTYLESNGLEHLLPEKTGHSLPYNLCERYLEQGIDHVLVGMRSIIYIDDLKGLF